MTPTPKLDLLRNAQLLVRLHDLIRSEQGASDKADQIRDELDTCWTRLDVDEKALIRGLSSDLHSLGRTGPPAAYSGAITEKVNEEFASQNWSEAIELLRTNDDAVDPAVGAYLRGLYWAHCELPDVVLLCLQDARRLDPVNLLYEFVELTACVQAGRAAEVAPRAQDIVSQSDDWVRVLAAAEVLFVWADELSPQAAVPIHCQAIAAARRGLALHGSSVFAADSSDERWKFHRVNANLNLALSCEQLGETSAALQACEDALRINPNDFNALMLYGWLKYPDYPTTERRVFCGRMRQTLISRRLEAHVTTGKAGGVRVSAFTPRTIA